MMITAEQFEEWKEHPVTNEIFKGLKEIENQLKDQLADGQTLGHAADVTHGLTNRVVGHLDGINQLLNISFVDVNNENEVDEITSY